MVRVGEVELEVFSRGSAAGEPIAFLHDLDYLNEVEYPFVEGLAHSRTVLVPSLRFPGGSVMDVMGVELPARE